MRDASCRSGHSDAHGQGVKRSWQHCGCCNHDRNAIQLSFQTSSTIFRNAIQGWRQFLSLCLKIYNICGRVLSQHDLVALYFELLLRSIDHNVGRHCEKLQIVISMSAYSKITTYKRAGANLGRSSQWRTSVSTSLPSHRRGFEHRQWQRSPPWQGPRPYWYDLQ